MVHAHDFTKFSAAAIINSKSHFANIIMKYWIAIFSAPKKIFSDNDGEFTGDNFYEMCERFNIKIETTLAFSPLSNGVCERYNQTLRTVLLKTKDNIKCDFETALVWTILYQIIVDLLHNSLLPVEIQVYQILWKNTLPAQEAIIKPIDFASYLTTLHAGRNVFIESESSNKLKNELQKSARSFVNTYNTGNKVFYKRNISSEWKDPAKGFGQDGPVLFIRPGSR